MDHTQLEQLGNELREIGHKRRTLAEKVYQEVQEGDNQSSKELYEELRAVSDHAIEIMKRQKQFFDDELQKL